MELGIQVKQALKELPPAERVVAIALKRIYEQIKKVYGEQQKQIDDIRLKYVDINREIQEKSAKIIAGKKLTENDLTKFDEYFVQQEKTNIKSVFQSASPIEDYWLVALKNSIFKNQISEKDESILQHLINISSKISENSIEITLVFKASKQIEAGSYTRIIELENDKPISFRGDKPKLSSTSQLKFINQLFTDSTDSQELFSKYDLVTFVVSQLIPYSLRFFLGETQDDDEEGQEDDENDQGEEEDDEQSEQQLKTRKKKN